MQKNTKIQKKYKNTKPKKMHQDAKNTRKSKKI